MEVLDKQLAANDPPETKITYDRLLASGIEEEEVRRLIATVIAGEIYDVMKSQKPFNQERFVKHLNELPKTSWLDEG